MRGKGQKLGASGGRRWQELEFQGRVWRRPLGGSSSLWVLLASYWGVNTLWGKCGEKVGKGVQICGCS